MAAPAASGTTVQAPSYSRGAIQVLNESQNVAAEMKDEFTSGEHVLIALATVDSPARRALTGHDATADALEEAAGDDAGHVVGQRRDQAAEGEEHERHDQDGNPPAEVGDAADQREHRDVPEQEARHDRRGLLELVDGHADRGHHLREREHHDVGVGGREADRDGGQREQQARPGLPRHGATISCSVP